MRWNPEARNQAGCSDKEHLLANNVYLRFAEAFVPFKTGNNFAKLFAVKDM